MIRQVRPIYLLLVPIILTFIFSFVLQSTVLANPQAYARWLSSFGPYFIFIYIIVQTFTIIVAPLGGFFIQVGLFAMLPPVQALLLIYAVSTPVYFINFYIARRFGRPIVQRLLGESSMQHIDALSHDIGPTMLLITKLFQGGVFDYVSYAAGLTPVSFQVFFLINIFAGLPGILISYIILNSFSNFTVSIMVLLLLTYALFGVALGLLYLRRKQRETRKN